MGQRLSAIVRLTDHDGALPREPVTVEWARRTAEHARAQAADLSVIRPAAALDAASARRIALGLNRDGRRAEASERLAEAVALLRGYAGEDPEILAQATWLDAERVDYSRPMTGLGMKQRYYSAMKAMKMGVADAPSAAVVALPTTLRLVQLAQTAVRAFEGVQGSPSLAVSPSLMTAPLVPGVLSREHELGLIARALGPSGPGASSVTVVLVEQGLHDNWFSHWHAGERVAVISLSGLEQTTSLPAEAFVAYELLLYGLSAVSVAYEPRKLLHPETRGCLFDLCQNKGEVGIKLQAGHVCAGCLRELAALGLDGDAVLRLWRAVRTLAQPCR